MKPVVVDITKRVRDPYVFAVYSVTNPQGQKYVGSTLSWKSRSNLYKNNSDKAGALLKQSFETYGLQNHIFEILQHDIEDEKTLREQEHHWGMKFDCLNTGLNIKLPKVDGRGGYRESYKLYMYKKRTDVFDPKKEEQYKQEVQTHNQAVKEAMEIAKANRVRKPRVVSEETRRKLSERVVTEETRKRMSQHQKGKPKLWKRIGVLDTQTGIQYDTLAQAAQALGFSEGTMSNYINGKTKQVTRFKKVN